VTPAIVTSLVASITSSDASQYSVSLPVVRMVPWESYVFCWQTLQFFWHDVKEKATNRKKAA